MVNGEGQNIGISGHNFKRGIISDKAVAIDEDWFAAPIPLLIQADYTVLITFHGALDTSSILEYTRNGTDYFALNDGSVVNAGQDFHQTIVACDGDQINIRAKTALTIKYLIAEANYDEALVHFPVAAVSGGATNHDLLSSTHTDTTPAAPSKGAIIRGVDLVKWEKIVGAIGQHLQIDAAGNVIWSNQRPSIVIMCYSTDNTANAQFFSFGGPHAGAGNETNRQSPIPTNGKIRKLSLAVSINGRTSATLFNLRINGVNGLNSVSVPAGLTGTFTDVINEDTVIQGDLINAQIIHGAGGGTFQIIGSSFEVIEQ